MWKDTGEQLKRKSITRARRMTKLRVVRGRKNVNKWMGLKYEEEREKRLG